MEVKETARIHWKLIGKIVIVILSIVLAVINYMYIAKLQNANTKSQLDLIQKEFEHVELLEQIHQKEFIKKIEKHDVIVKKKQKVVDEIKESIKNPSVDLNVIRIQDSINTAFNLRFP
tara:strand:+ start:906 stop:1259 length:354 start_codon:yes stop_codon:yes gene_type:complete